MKKIRILSMLMACMLLLTGCWDKVELEDRAFVLAIGVDKADGKSEDNESGILDKYSFSFANPDTAKAEEGKVNDYVTFEVQAPSYHIAITRLLQRFAQYHTYEHTKALIFGKELLEDEVLFKAILDAFRRGTQFNTSMYVFMTLGEAADILKAKPKMKSLLAYYITGIAENEKYATSVGNVSFLDFARQLLDNEGDGVIPDIELHEDGLISKNLGIIKDYKHIGHLNTTEAIAWKWLNGKARGGVIEIEDGSISIPFNFSHFSRKIYLDKIEDGKIYLIYNMKTEGSIEEYTLEKDLMEKEKLASLESKIEQKIRKDSLELVKKMQEEYKVDLLGVREYLFKYHPRVYEEIKDNFDENFEKNIIIDVKVDVSIRRIGKIK